MVFQISPGVNVSEIDLTTVVPAAATTDGALAGVFSWGPLNEVDLVASEIELVNRYGRPTNDTAVWFFTAANFLAYGNKLRLVRVADESTALNATCEDGTGSNDAGVGLLIKNMDHYEQNYANGSADVGLFAARYPGELGNSLKISLCPSSTAFARTLTGTVSSTGATLTGTGTAFDTQLEVGSILTLPSGEEVKVVSIASATSAVVDDTPTPALSGATLTARWEYANQFGIAPNTSNYAAAKNGSNDELHVIVVDEDGLFTGIPGTILEKYSFLSKAADAKKEDGTVQYYAESINRLSKYVLWTDHIGATDFGDLALNNSFSVPSKPFTYSFSGGVDGSTAVDADFIRGYDLFADPENVEVSLVLGASAGTALAIHLINNICESRKDCVVFLSPEFDDVVDNPGSEVEDAVEFRNTLPSSSYAVLDSGWKYQYDKYNDVYRWVPLNGDIAGLCVRTDELRDAWWSPAGLNRGHIKNVVRLSYNPNKAQRDDLYMNGINPVVTFPGQGTVLYGDKTLLAKPSAFDRINVRRLFIVLEKAISKASRYSLFEFNDEITRAQFRNLVEPFLRDVQGRRGIIDFRVVCDHTNNTGEVIDRNEFVGDIYIKPARSINYIQLNFVAVRTGVAFEEIVGSF